MPQFWQFQSPSVQFPAFPIAIGTLGKIYRWREQINLTLCSPASPPESGLLQEGPTCSVGNKSLPQQHREMFRMGSGRKTGFGTEGKGWKPGCNSAVLGKTRAQEDFHFQIRGTAPARLHSSKGIFILGFKSKKQGNDNFCVRNHSPKPQVRLREVWTGRGSSRKTRAQQVQFNSLQMPAALLATAWLENQINANKVIIIK